jgi:predicted DNA-binding transcriptional regulator
MSEDVEDYVLKGTTLRVYRYMYRSGTPLGIHDVQRALKLSSPSVAEYHIKKLMRAGLVQERQDGYVVDRVMFENVIRIRKLVIPIQTTYVAFFLSTLVVLVAFLRPSTVTSLYFFALAINVGGLLITAYEAIKTFIATS